MAKETKEPRPNREKDKIGGKGFDRFPRDNRFKCKVINLESPGDSVRGSVNGVRFEVHDQADVYLHKSQIFALQTGAVVHTSKYDEGPDGNFVITPITVPRVMVQVLDMTPVDLDELEKRDKSGKFKKKAEAPAPIVPGAPTEGTPQQLGGRT